MRNVPTPKEPKIPNSVHDRINQLEKLVTDLMSSKNVPEVSPAASYTPQHQDDGHYEIPGTPDRVKFNGETTSYTNSDHWTSILDGVRPSSFNLVSSAQQTPDLRIAGTP